MTTAVTREQVLAYRVRAQQLDRDDGPLVGTSVLDIGVQDSGPDGAPWALAVRGVDVATSSQDDLVLLWTLRGTPNVYLRSDLPSVAAAVAPFSDADAGKRILSAAKPLKEAGIGNLEALDVVAGVMRRVVTEPMVKGEVSRRLTDLVDAPYVRFCRPCDATHVYEMPFRLAAVRAGLELEPGTSPPVLRPVPGFQAAPEAEPRHDPVRAYLHLLGPATPQHVAGYLDTTVREVKSRWPSDAVEVEVDGQVRWVLADDEPLLDGGPVRVTRLLGPFDLFLQGRDHDLLVDDPARSKALWPTLGRPGAVLVDGEVAGLWRPRSSGRGLTVTLTPWQPFARRVLREVTEQAERLATHRDVRLTGVAVTD